MVAPKQIKIKNLSDFSLHVEKLMSSTSFGNWYRGVGRSNSYKLEPSLYRHPTAKNIDSLLVAEAKMLQQFTGSVMINQGPFDFEKDPLKTLFYMQHYGVPTRLLDWSTNPFIALYFALTSADATNDDAAVWVIDPTSWNEKVLEHVTWGKGGPLNYGDAKAKYGPYTLHMDVLDPSNVRNLIGGAACVFGIASNARMFAQRGVFSMFGSNLSPMEDQFSADKYPANILTKLIIPQVLIDPLLILLLKLGFTDSVSYPDVGGLAMEIKRTHGFKV